MSESNVSTAELVEKLKWLAGDMYFSKEMDEASLLAAVAERLESLENELKAAKAMAEEIAGDFVDYVCTGTINPAPYCKNKCEGCTDKYGMCAGVKCIGFAPKAWREEDEAD